MMESGRNVLMQRDLVEDLVGINLDEAVKIAESNPLGMDEIFYRVRNAVLGRYYACSGSEFAGRMLVNSCAQSYSNLRSWLRC